MSTSAGRVLVLPKGNYNASTTYNMLDCVYYNGRSYLCKQTSIGNPPTNTTYWQPMTADNSAEIQALTNQLEDETKARAALGAHNFLKTTISSQTKNGITLTVNSDKSITVSTEAGGATETTVFNVCEGYSLKAGTYIYSGVPATGSSTTTYYLDMRTDTSSQFIIDSSRPEREITTAGQSGNDARLIVMSGVVITTPITFKPMIRLAIDADPTYQPYAKTNLELTQLGLKQVYAQNVNPVSDPDQYLKRIELTVTTGSKAELLIFSASMSANNVAPIKMTLRTSSIIEERVCPDTSRIWDFYAQTRFIHIPLMQASNTTITYELWGQWSGTSDSEGAYMEIERIGI